MCHIFICRLPFLNTVGMKFSIITTLFFWRLWKIYMRCVKSWLEIHRSYIPPPPLSMHTSKFSVSGTDRVPDLHGHVCRWWWAWSSRTPGGGYSYIWWPPWTPCPRGCYGWSRWVSATSAWAWTPPHVSRLAWWWRTWCPHCNGGLPLLPQLSPGHQLHLGSPSQGHSFARRD